MKLNRAVFAERAVTCAAVSEARSERSASAMSFPGDCAAGMMSLDISGSGDLGPLCSCALDGSSGLGEALGHPGDAGGGGNLGGELERGCEL